MLIGISVKGVPVAGVIHQPFVGVGGKASAPADATSVGRFGVGRTLWGAAGMGAWSHEVGDCLHDHFNSKKKNSCSIFFFFFFSLRPSHEFFSRKDEKSSRQHTRARRDD